MFYRNTVTHLLATNVGSEKYHAAVKVGCPVVSQDWIHACWEAHSKVDVEKYKLLPLTGIK